MRYACIARHRGAFAVALMCRVLAVSRAGFYAWLERPPSARARADGRLRIAIRAIHAESQRCYGSPRVHRELRAQTIRCSRKRVVRLMQAEGLRAKRSRRYRTTTQADATRPVAPNVLARQFHVAGLNRAWVGDVTACWTREGWLYVAVLLDLGSRRVVGWTTSAVADQALTLAALHRALVVRPPPPGLVHHSDQGAHYTGAEYQATLAAHGLTVSMSRKGNCWAMRWRKASSPRSRPSWWPRPPGQRGRPRRRPSAATSKPGTIAAAGTRRWITSAPWSTNSGYLPPNPGVHENGGRSQPVNAPRWRSFWSTLTRQEV